MFQDLYFVTCDCIRREVEYVFSTQDKFRGIKSLFFPYDTDLSQNTSKVYEIINELNCDNDILVLCDDPCPGKSPIPEDYCGSFSIHRVERLYEIFTSRSVLEDCLDTEAFVVLPGWLENWQENSAVDRSENPLFALEGHSSVLVIDTGLYPDIPIKAQEFAESAGLPLQILNVGLDHFSLAIENIILRLNLEKKQNQLRSSQRKAASYAMSLDFIRSIADMNDESEAIDSICKLFETLFAPKDIFYIPFDKNRPCGKQCNSLPPDSELLDSFKESNASYVLLDSEDGFAVRVSSNDEVLGVVEVHNIAFQEHIEEYLSIALDLAKASGLVISNIRRYHEIFRSREELVRLTDMLRTTNRILRHDIANDLQVITVSLDLLEEKQDEKFIKMSQKAVQRSISLIRSMRDLDYALSPDNQLELQSVKSIVTSVTERYDAEFHVKGDCLVMIDSAFFSVIDNIVSNALVHGSASRIDVNIDILNESCKIDISDNGTGIPEDIRPYVFDEGFKYGKTGHTGFGLYIVKKTIERYNGTIRTEDNDSGGAKFLIELPLASTGG